MSMCIYIFFLLNWNYSIQYMFNSYLWALRFISSCFLYFSIFKGSHVFPRCKNNCSLQKGRQRQEVRGTGETQLRTHLPAGAQLQRLWTDTRTKPDPLPKAFITSPITATSSLPQLFPYFAFWPKVLIITAEHAMLFLLCSCLLWYVSSCPLPLWNALHRLLCAPQVF